MISGHFQILMNLIRDHINLMFFTNVHDFPEFFFLPDSSYRIVGRTKHKKFHALFHDAFFKSFIIHHVSGIPADQRTLHNGPVIVDQRVLERIIYRRHDQHRIPFFCQNMKKPVNGRNYTRRKPDPVLFHLILMMGCLPVHKCLLISVGMLIISKHSLIQIFLQSFLHTGRRLKIHVCHPQRQKVLPAKLLQAVVPLCRIRIFSFFVNYLSHAAPLFRIIATLL